MTPLIFIFQLLIAVPVAIVLALTSVWYIWESGNTVLYASFAQKMFSGIENYGLLAIPLFMLTGELMNEGGMTRRLINAARVFVGGFRGGLAYINLLANMFMAAIIGSATAQIAVMSRAMVPEMEKEGYDKGFAAATTAAGGLLAPVIPPSMMFVIYGVLAQIPIGDMFLAGILPGLLLSAAFAGVIALVGFRKGFPKGRWYSSPEAVSALLQCLPAMLIPIAIIGGVLFGIATPTEGGAMGAAGALILAIARQRLSWKLLKQAMETTGKLSSFVVFILVGSTVFGLVFRGVNGDLWVEHLLLGLPLETRASLIEGAQFALAVLSEDDGACARQRQGRKSVGSWLPDRGNENLYQQEKRKTLHRHRRGHRLHQRPRRNAGHRIPPGGKAGTGMRPRKG